MYSGSVILIGMPGSGKSTVGKALSKRLGIDFCDTDDLIIQSTGEALQDTLDKRGRNGFLDKERRVLEAFRPDKPTVISTGGSVVLHKDIMEQYKAIGKIVFLDADLPLLRKRLWNMENRGIVLSESGSDLLSVYKEREPLYYRYSDIRVHIRRKQVNEMVEEIINMLNADNIAK